MEDFVDKRGFLFKKNRNSFLRWHLRWMVLDSKTRTFSSYSNEVETSELKCIQLSRSTIIEVLPAEGEEYQFIFTVHNSNDKENPLVVCASDSASIEAWMMHLIQISQGSWRESENFNACFRQSEYIDNLASEGDFSLRQSLQQSRVRLNSWDQAENKAILSNENENEDEFEEEEEGDEEEEVESHQHDHDEEDCAVGPPVLPIRGYLLKRNDTTQSWNKRFFVLDETCIFRGYKTEEEARVSTDGMRTARVIDAAAIVSPLPIGYENQQLSFALVTSARATVHAEGPTVFNSPNLLGETQSRKTLRLAVSTQSELNRWISALTFVIEMQGTDYTADDKEKVVTLPSIAEDDADPTYSPSSVKNYFDQHDRTLWARMHGTLRSLHPNLSARKHLFTDQSINTLYVRFFTVPYQSGDDPSSDSQTENTPRELLVIVYENQRLVPLRGWSSLHLLGKDPFKLSSSAGVKFPYRYLKFTDPPIGYRWEATAVAVAGTDTDIRADDGEAGLTSFPRLRSNRPDGDSDSDGDSDGDGEGSDTIGSHLKGPIKTRSLSLSSSLASVLTTATGVASGVATGVMDIVSSRHSKDHKDGAGSFRSSSGSTGGSSNGGSGGRGSSGDCSRRTTWQSCEEWIVTDGISGWKYASSFDKFQGYLQPGHVRLSPSIRSLVRRRQWTRKAVLIEQEEGNTIQPLSGTPPKTRPRDGDDISSGSHGGQGGATGWSPEKPNTSQGETFHT